MNELLKGSIVVSDIKICKANNDGFFRRSIREDIKRIDEFVRKVETDEVYYGKDSLPRYKAEIEYAIEQGFYKREDLVSSVKNDGREVVMTKVTKAGVKSLLKQGSVEVGMIPCKANLDSVWINPMWVTVNTEEELEKYINEFEYYNCNTYVGRYPHYYVRKEVK